MRSHNITDDACKTCVISFCRRRGPAACCGGEAGNVERRSRERGGPGRGSVCSHERVCLKIYRECEWVGGWVAVGVCALLDGKKHTL